MIDSRGFEENLSANPDGFPWAGGFGWMKVRPFGVAAEIMSSRPGDGCISDVGLLHILPPMV